MDGIEAQLTGLGRQLASGSRDAWSAEQRIAIGKLWIDYNADLDDKAGSGSAELQAAADNLNIGLATARRTGDSVLESFALGYLGTVAEQRNALDEALQLSRRAAFRAQQAHAPVSEYLWQWQTGRVLAAMGDTKAAVAAYRQSAATLDLVRSQLARGSAAQFARNVSPVFFEMADLLLRAEAATAKERQINLALVRSTIERLKVAEVQDYFDDQCVLQTEEEKSLDELDAAVIYPILLPDRLELLISHQGHIEQFTVDVERAVLTEVVRRYREGLERRTQRRYRAPAKQLYEWLVAPAQAFLEGRGVRTLVFVPDGPLRTVPMAALYDGERFLVESFAISTTLGLTLTSPQSLARDDMRVLANGLTEAVQGYRGLPSVADELENISALYDTEQFRDEDFQLNSLSRAMSEGDFSIVHIATHGEFKSDHRESFLLTYDDRMTLDMLEQTVGLRRLIQEGPVELLVLSACKTAAGDDRAALGLAGVALKAGARSALATLWFVNDESSSRLVSRFYEELRSPTVSKAEALRTAQLELIGDRRYAHPALWSAFLLLGNWL
jgi:CHAT domain-containing protein